MHRRTLLLMLAGILAVGCSKNSSPPQADGSAATTAQVAVGALAPDVTLTLHDGSSVKLRDLQGEQVLLYFYPKDDTPG